MTALVDTCIIIDALANRGEFAPPAQELLLCGSEKRVELVISAKTMLDVHYILKHYFHDEPIVRGHLSNLLDAVSVIDTAGACCIRALNSVTTDFEDAVQIETAIDEGVDCIVTRDGGGYSNSLIQVLTAGGLLSLLDSCKASERQ